MHSVLQSKVAIGGKRVTIEEGGMRVQIKAQQCPLPGRGGSHDPGRLSPETIPAILTFMFVQCKYIIHLEKTG